MNIVIWAAGIGSGMWPMANEKVPQYFIKILKNENNEYESALQRIYRQITKVYSKDKIYVVINKSYKKILEKQIGKEVNIIIEPFFQNKSLSIINAALYLKEHKANISQESLVFMSADFYVDMDFYNNIRKIERIIEKLKKPIAILGIKKKKYYKKYKYIYEKDGKAIDFINSVTIANLRDVVRNKGYINADVMGMNLQYLLDLIKQETSISNLKQFTKSFEEISNFNIIDLYKLKDEINVVKFSGKWDNISSWETLIDYMDDELFNNPNAYKIMGCNTKDIKDVVSIDIADNAMLNMSKQCMSYISYT